MCDLKIANVGYRITLSKMWVVKRHTPFFNYLYFTIQGFEFIIFFYSIFSRDLEEVGVFYLRLVCLENFFDENYSCQ